MRCALPILLAPARVVHRVPGTEFWARVPSALAVGVAAAGVVVLGRQLCVRSVGVAAGIVFAVLP